MNIFDRHDYKHQMKGMAYAEAPVQRAPSANYRQERGYPYQRGGKLVVATPQFRTLTLYSPTNQNLQLPGTASTGVAIRYPVKP